MSGSVMPLLALVVFARGRTVEKAVRRCVIVFVSVVPVYREGDELHLSPMSLEGRDEGGVLRGLGFVLGVASEVPAESDFDDDEGAEALVEGDRVRGGGFGYPSSVDETRRCSMSSGVEFVEIYQ